MFIYVSNQLPTIARYMIAANHIDYLKERISRYDDQHAYSELFISFYTPLLRFTVSFVKLKEPAEEIVSDIFIGIWEKRKQLDAIANLKVYLYVAAKNRALNYLSRQRRHQVSALEDAEITVDLFYPNPEQLLITAEMVRRVKEAVNQLPPQCRIIFKMVKEDELKYREVAEILGLSIKTVENQLAIALKKIDSSIRFDNTRAVPNSSRPGL